MADEVVLITGYPGLQARRMLVHVLTAEVGTHVVLLVLNRLVDEALAALTQLSDAHRQRVRVLEGDAAAIDLGLSGQEFRQLAAEVTRIHSIAHISYLGASEQEARLVNVRSAAEVVELGLACDQLRCIVHHSTAYVSGDRAGLVYEDDLDRQQGFHSPVHKTRMLAELVLKQAMGKLPIAIVRPTMLVGDSLSGEADRFDGPYLMVLVVLATPRDMPVSLPTGNDNPINIVPVDYVVKAAHHIGLHRNGPGRTYHLASQETFTTDQVFSLIVQASGRTAARRYVPEQLTRMLLHAPGVDRWLRHPRTFLRQLATGARYDTRAARAILLDSGIECPPLASYIDTWISAVEDHLQHSGGLARSASAAR